MKKIIFLIAAFSLVLTSSLKVNSQELFKPVNNDLPCQCLNGQIFENGKCITKRVKNCLVIDAPVCGCDRTTYKNSCEAENYGITSYTVGKCKKLNKTFKFRLGSE